MCGLYILWNLGECIDAIRILLLKMTQRMQLNPTLSGHKYTPQKKSCHSYFSQ